MGGSVYRWAMLIEISHRSILQVSWLTKIGRGEEDVAAFLIIMMMMMMMITATGRMK